MGVKVHVLGTAQDGGVPHAGCACPTCAATRAGAIPRRSVACIAVVGETGRTLVIDATPDLPRQVVGLDALLLTHAHTGHYIGLAHLGREGMNVQALPVHVSTRMRAFLMENKPWSHLVERGQILLETLDAGDSLEFDGATLHAFDSPHRAEDTDTLGIEIRGPEHSLVYIPDADAFTPDLVRRIEAADVALVDGTFYDLAELPGRDMREVPHPRVAESVRVLANARGRVFFTHLNHTNALLRPDPPPLPEPFAVLEEGAMFGL